MPSHVLQFGVVKLKAEGGRRKAELYLRCNASENLDVDFTGNEGVLTSFCFPLGPDAVPPKEYMASEEFTFTLTYGDGRRFQGFCRKFLPPAPSMGSKLRYPQVIFIIAEFPWCTFYFKALQVLEQLVKAGESLLESDLMDLPLQSHAASFLRELSKQVSQPITSGQYIKVPLPKTASMMGVSPPRFLGLSGNQLTWGEEQVELQVPPDCGNGRWNCGISLARLLWHVPVSAMLTLLGSMLMERRIILMTGAWLHCMWCERAQVGQARDTVTAAVQAASALLYPFKWHHIYLPMLPRSFMDYLTAPMPYLVGLPAQMLPMLKGIPMDEVTLVDLDLGKCDPAPGCARDDARMLPWRDELEAALSAVHKNIRSPTEYETSPMIAGVMQEYFCRVFGNYRRFIHADNPVAAAHWSATLGGSQHGLPASQAHSAMASPRPARDGSIHRRESVSESVGTRGIANHQADEALKGSGQVFEQAAFVDAHRRRERVRKFLAAFRHSQMYEVWVQERLKVAAGLEMDPDVMLFEGKLTSFLEARRERKDSARTRATAPPTQSKWRTMINRHRRTDSGEHNGVGAGVVGKAVSKLGSSIRRMTTDTQSLSADGRAPTVTADPPAFDPASFFPDDNDDDDDMGLSSPGDGHGGGSHMGSVHGGRSSMRSSTASMDTLARNSVGAHPSMDPYSVGSAVGNAYLVDHQGMTVTVAPDGHRVYEGSMGDMVKGVWSDMKTAIKSAAASPQNMARQQAAGSAGTRGPVSGAARLFDNLLGGNNSPTLTSQPDRPTSLTVGMSTVSSASASAGPGYRRQLTGDGKPSKSGGLARYMPQTTGDRNLLVGSKLRMPPPPSRPLAVLQPALEESAAEGGSGRMLHVSSLNSVHAAADAGEPEEAPAPKTGNLLGVDDFDGFAALAGRTSRTSSRAVHAAKHVSILDL